MLHNLMRHRIAISRPSITKGASGGQVKTLTTIYEDIPAFVQPVSGNAVVYYQQRDIEVTHEIYTNQSLTIQVGDRVVYGQRTFVIKDFRNLCEMDRVWIIGAQELLNTSVSSSSSNSSSSSSNSSSSFSSSSSSRSSSSSSSSST